MRILKYFSIHPSIHPSIHQSINQSVNQAKPEPDLPPGKSTPRTTRHQKKYTDSHTSHNSTFHLPPSLPSLYQTLTTSYPYSISVPPFNFHTITYYSLYAYAYQSGEKICQ
ncbi:hypothetical protein OCU04_000057 [Sclerotinia nivalis]|uniref:Uncharacterized protein n=1 Tax=Sclerotinia nivalis TaxID=352851 RepID=A0A9X0AVD1_9HELO|nr:hypothetical protein OCU04_000057 [Sclerotinia nivalis]